MHPLWSDLWCGSLNGCGGSFYRMVWMDRKLISLQHTHDLLELLNGQFKKGSIFIFIVTGTIFVVTYTMKLI